MRADHPVLSNMSRLLIMAYLATHGKATLTRLSTDLGIPPNRAAYHLDALEREGYVEKGMDLRDLRERIYTPTDQGLRETLEYIRTIRPLLAL